MIAALGLLGIVAAGMGFTAWLVVSGLAFASEADRPLLVGTAATVGIVLLVVALEARQIRTVESAADATPVSGDEYPELQAATTRMAAVMGTPVPTLAVSSSAAPEAMVVGFRPSGVHLVVSEATLDALDADELEAVVAHELAHVKNRDATVTTVVAMPVVIARGIEARSEIDDDGQDVVYWFGRFWSWIGGKIVGILSKTRELAADRAAARATGSPAALASALRTLDARIEATPDEDLRDVTAVSALSILPLEATGRTSGEPGAEPAFEDWPDDEIRARTEEILRDDADETRHRELVRSHPSTERLERLQRDFE